MVFLFLVVKTVKSEFSEVAYDIKSQVPTIKPHKKLGYSSNQVGRVKFCCGIMLYGTLSANIRNLKKKE